MTICDFLNFLDPLPSASDEKNWDVRAAAFGLEEFLLMENAARSALAVLLSHVPQLKNKNILVLMGNGNNGGDAACLARNLCDLEANCLICATRPKESFNSICSRHLELAMKNGAAFHLLESAETVSCASFLEFALTKIGAAPDVIVDGLLGTGFSGKLKCEMQKLIENVNFLSDILRAFVLALDIPSGLNSASGRAAPIAIKANATASFAGAKPGEIFSHAKEWTGKLHVCNIGMPRKIMTEARPKMWLLDGHALQCLPKNPANSYKNYFGHIYVLGGALGYSGAARLAAQAALASGSGLATVVAPPAAAQSIKAGSGDNDFSSR